MDKRSLFALFLIALVIVGGQLLMPRTPPAPTIVDSVATTPTAPTAAQTATPNTVTAGLATKVAPFVAPPTIVAVRPETTTLSGTGRIMAFASPGAAPASITLTDFPDLRRRNGPLSIVPTRGPLMRYRIVNGVDTISLDHLSFAATRTTTSTELVSTTPAIRVRYEMTPGNFITHATISFAAAKPDAKLLVDLAQDIRSSEVDTTEDFRHLAYGYRTMRGDVESVMMQKLDSTQNRVELGPLDWVAVRSKYFAVALIARDTTRGFSDFTLRGGHRRPGGTATGIATATMPLTSGTASFDLFTGPQSWYALKGAGHDLININPYAGWAWLKPVVQPFSTIVMRVLLGLKGALGLSYGWVLVIFGISIRLLLWPLNQSAMRTSMKMQRIQPELAAVQKKYAKDPEGQRTAMVKLYQAHGMSPFSPLMGCLPMLIPMPILFALYFVFQNTIEFRGVSFLWLPDISLRDPYYITPIVMGASMLVLSWIGMRAAPPQPQAKVMGYMMPAMFTLMFLNFASGLNLYYAVQNLVAIPQQWLLTRERAKGNVAVMTAKTVTPLKAPR